MDHNPGAESCHYFSCVLGGAAAAAAFTQTNNPIVVEYCAKRPIMFLVYTKNGCQKIILPVVGVGVKKGHVC